MALKKKKTKFQVGPITKITKNICGGAGFGAVYKPPPGVGFPMNIAMTAFFATASFAVGTVGKLNIKRHQKYRDRRAESILNSILTSNSPNPFSLYLRSFDTTGKLLEILEKKTVLPFTYDDTDLETFIACAVEPYAPLIALGIKGEQIGAGRILCDGSNWENCMEILAKNAKIIFAIPYDTDGTKTEINFIKNNNLIRKTIFVMPPQAVKNLDWKKQWEKATYGIEKFGFNLPRYNPAGMLFYMKNPKEVKYREDFVAVSYTHLRAHET